jgi:hypothetical protein
MHILNTFVSGTLLRVLLISAAGSREYTLHPGGTDCGEYVLKRRERNANEPKDIVEREVA